MSVMNDALKGVAGVADVTGKFAAGARDKFATFFSEWKAASDDSKYIRSLMDFEKAAGKMSEVHKQAHAYRAEREDDCDLVPSFSRAVVHVLRERDKRRQDELKSNVRRLEYYK